MSQKVSIIMPSYNSAEFIGRSIDCILAQTYENWELLIVDDCSTDETTAIVSRYQDPRIRLLQNENNSGAAISRNYGLREATGKWIAFLDSDDYWLPEKLEKQIRYMTEHNYSFTYTDYRIVTPEGEALPYIHIAPNKVTRLGLYLYCWFSTITVMYDREKVGLVQIADVRKNNDYALWFAVAEKADSYRFPECLSIYYKRRNSISSGSKLKLIKHHYILYRKALNKNPVSAVFFTGVNLVFGTIRKLFYKKPFPESCQ